MSDESQAATDMPNFTSLYFGYASNLSPRTMKQRCPDCLYVGMAYLEGWKWIINQTGYATIIPSPDDTVYGGLFFLSGRDEAALDHSEGVPWLNEKHPVPVVRLDGGDTVQAVTYVDVKRTEEGRIEPEYVIIIQRAIRDGLQAGVPESYFDKYFKPFTSKSPQEEKEITLIRTTWTPTARSLEPESVNAGKEQTKGWMMGVGGGRMKDASTS